MVHQGHRLSRGLLYPGKPCSHQSTQLPRAVQDQRRWTLDQCEKNNLKLDEHLEEAAELLKTMFVENIYRKMQGIDRTLRGKGYPDKLPLRPVSDEITRMSQFIEDHVNSKKALWKSAQETTVDNTKNSTTEKKKKMVGSLAPTTRRAASNTLHRKFDVIAGKIYRKKMRAPTYKEIINHTDWPIAIEDSGVGSELPADKTMRNWLSDFNKSAI